MAHHNNPVIIRQPSVRRWTKPGLHTYSVRRRFNAVRKRISNLSILQLCLVFLGLAGVGYYTYTLADEHVYQSFQNWAFDQGIAGRANVTFVDYLSERTPWGFLLRGTQATAAAPIPAKADTSDTAQKVVAAVPTRPVHGALLGRLEIPRLRLSAMVREGVDDKILSVAVGHVPATALAGQAGNFAIAAHRDTLFRALKDVRSDDRVTFQSPDGGAYEYRVAATQIVKPSDVNVLRADGGGLITSGGSTRGMPKLLTMITCYPFSYVGSAPKRFIVEAKLTEGEEVQKVTVPAAAMDQAPSAPPSKEEVSAPARKIPVHAAAHARRTPRIKHAAVPSRSFSVPAKPAKKKGFWRKIFGND